MFRRAKFPGNNDGTIQNDLGLKDRAGWVLVGGQSSRMGADKALIEIDGRALALRVAHELASVCGSVGLAGDPARYSQLGLPVTADEFAGQGPLAGIEAALRATGAAWNLIVACDMPGLRAPMFEALFEAAAPSCDAVMPMYEDGRVEPLCAVYHRRSHGAVRAALMAGIRKVTDALRGLEIRYVRVAEDALFANLNTPEELRKYTNG